MMSTLNFSKIILLLIVLCACFCRKAENLTNLADGIIEGDILPGEAAGYTGPIHVVASFTNDLEKITWSGSQHVVTNRNAYKIKELVAGKYYVIMYMDVNRNDRIDSGEPLGGYEADGDDRFDPVTLAGGETLKVDIRFFGFYETE